MSRAVHAFRLTSATRAIKAVQAAGLQPVQLEIDKDGKITVTLREAPPAEQVEPADA